MPGHGFRAAGAGLLVRFDRARSDLFGDRGIWVCGRGYQTLINETLRQGLATDTLKEALREVIREELRTA